MITRYATLFVLAVSTCAAGEPWEVCQFVAYTKPQPFYLFCWGDDGNSFYGTFTYAAYRAHGEPPPASLHGTRDGEWFRPNVTLQISRSWDGPWKTIKRLRVGTEVFTVDKDKGASDLRVRLDAFRPHLRSIRCGRIVLESGEAATIDLSKLLHKDESATSHK
jgi:hypothetical protein